MNEIKISGKVIAVREIEIVKTFQKRAMFVRYTEIGKDGNEYEQTYKIEFSGNQINEPVKHKVGDEVTVHCRLRGFAYKNKQGQNDAGLSLSGWKIESSNAVQSQPQTNNF